MQAFIANSNEQVASVDFNLLKNGRLGQGLFVLPGARHCIYQESSGLHISTEAPAQSFKSKQDPSGAEAVKKLSYCHLVQTTHPITTPLVVHA